MGATKNWQRNIDAAIADLVASGDVLLTSQINQPSGVAGLDAAGNLNGTLVHRYGTAAVIDNIPLGDGELAFVTDLGELRLGDGSTLGGSFVSGRIRVAGSISPIELVTVGAPYDASDDFYCSAGGVYRIDGAMSFSGDTDLKANFLTAFHATPPAKRGTILDTSDTSDLNSITAIMNGSWRYGFKQTPYVAALLSPGSSSSAGVGNYLYTFDGVTQINFDSGTYAFSVMFGVNASGSFGFHYSLKTAKTLTPTIMLNRVLTCQRLK